MKWVSQALGLSLCSVGMQIMRFWEHSIGFLKQWLPWAQKVIQAQELQSNHHVLKRCIEREFQQTQRLLNPLPPLPCLPVFLKKTGIGNKTILSLFWETAFWNISFSRTYKTQLSIQFHWQGEKTSSIPWSSLQSLDPFTKLVAADWGITQIANIICMFKL